MPAAKAAAKKRADAIVQAKQEAMDRRIQKAHKNNPYKNLGY